MDSQAEGLLFSRLLQNLILNVALKIGVLKRSCPTIGLLKHWLLRQRPTIWLEKFQVCSKSHLIFTDFGLRYVCADKRQRGQARSLPFLPVLFAFC